MMRRDRHGRGMRGPLAGRNDFTGSPVPVRTPPRGAALFAECLRTSVATGMAHCPQAFVGVDIGFEEIPTNVERWWADKVPLASATSATTGHNATVVLFRRPIEHRANDTAELRRLVHRALVEQLAALTGIDAQEIDPDFDTDQ